MRERHRAVLDERHGLAVAAQAHHDVEAGLAHLPQGFLRRRVRHFHQAIAKARVAEHLCEVVELSLRGAGVFAGEFDEQDRSGCADQRALDHRTECGIRARELDHRAIDEFNR